MDRASRKLDHEQAIAALSLLRRIHPLSLPYLSRGEFHERMGQALTLLGETRSARISYTKALLVYTRLGDRSGLESVWMRLGHIERQLENFHLAEKHYAAVLASRRSPHDTDARLGRALCQRGQGRFWASLGSMKPLLSWYKRKEDLGGLAYTYWAMATTERFLGRFHQAEAHAAQSTLLYRRLKDEGGTAYALCALGGIQRMRGAAARSFHRYSQALTIFRRLKDRFGIAYASCGVGNSYRMRNQLHRALPYSKKAESIYRQLGLQGPLGYVLWSLSQIQIMRGQKEAARRSLAETERLFKRVKDVRGLVYANLGWGEWKRRFKTGDPKPYFSKAAASGEAARLPMEALHARARLHPERSFCSAYRRLGVLVSKFQTYRSWP